jgi:hypothetical protein
VHARNRRSAAANADRKTPQRTLQSEPPQQMTLAFEPALCERFGSLREFIAFRVQELQINAKALAADMDLSPTVLSRKLAPKDGDTSRFTVDDLEAYMRVTRDTAPLEYLAAKFLETPEARRDRALTRFETLLSQGEDALRMLRAAS